MTIPFVRTTPPHAIRRWPLPTVPSDTIEALRDELEEATDAAARTAAVERFRAHLERERTPLIEADAEGDTDWCRATFVFLGEAPGGVLMQLNRISDPLDPEDTMLEQIAGSEVHALTLRLPAAWQGGYLFAIAPRRMAATLHQTPDMRAMMEFARNAQADPYARERIPSKEVTATGGLEIPDYSAARGPKAPTVALWHNEPTEATQLGSVVSPIGGAQLPLHHWAAPGADASSPVILLLDGEVWLRQFPIASALIELVAGGTMPPVHVLYLESGGSRQREFDYTCGPETSLALLEGVREASAHAVPATPWVIAGQSLGGLFSALAATRHPQFIRAAVAQSPSLWWPSDPSPWQKPAGWFEERAAAAESDAPGAPILIEAGAIDAGVVEYARSAAALLRTQNALIAYNEYSAGHDILQWQSTLADALATALR